MRLYCSNDRPNRPTTADWRRGEASDDDGCNAPTCVVSNFNIMAKIMNSAPALKSRKSRTHVDLRSVAGSAEIQSRSAKVELEESWLLANLASSTLVCRRRRFAPISPFQTFDGGKHISVGCSYAIFHRKTPTNCRRKKNRRLLFAIL